MLTADLVRARSWRGEVRPFWVDGADGDTVQLARDLLDLFESCVGRTRRELDGRLADHLGTGTAFLLHRGLARLLRERCRFETEAPLPPVEIRRAVFEIAGAARGTPRFDRSEALAAASQRLHLSEAEIERGLFADLEGEQVLVSWDRCDAAWLLNRYNVALAQGVVLRAHRLDLVLEGLDPRGARAFFRQVKFHQLLHRIETRAEGYLVRLDGPMSLFRAHQRYGVQMASFLPTLLHFDRWSLAAEVTWGRRRSRADFHLSSGIGLQPIGRLPGRWHPDELQLFQRQFEGLASEWTISDEVELVDLGADGVLVPDFAFRHRESGKRVLFEILGHWRRGGLERRLALADRHRREDLLLAVPERLCADEEAGELPDSVVPFRRTLGARRVLAALRRRWG